MRFKFINNVIITTLLLAVVSSTAVAFSFGWQEALALLCGASWGCGSLWLFKSLIERLYQKHYDATTALIFLVKFPLLYAGGVYLLIGSPFQPAPLLFGFLILFFAILLNGTAALFTKKSALILIALTSTSSLQASIEAEVPEVPNFIQLLYNMTGSAWAGLLHHWENIFFSIVVAIGISIVFLFGAKKKEKVPTGLQNFLEFVVEKLRDFVVEILGPEGERYVPFLGTLFIYILCMNWLVLIPLMKPPSSSFSITIALAICVFVLVQFLNIKNYGFFGFLYHLAGSPKGLLGWALVPLLLPIEILTQITRPLTLSLRLFGNVVGEDILIGAFALFGALVFANLNAPVGLPLQIPFMFLALLTGLMQALVFTLLSTIYILLSLSPSEEH